MISQSYLIRLLAIVAVANALPLNINLGAYSPAVVVGDGAIEFEGGEGASLPIPGGNKQLGPREEVGAEDEDEEEEEADEQPDAAPKVVKRQNVNAGFDRALTFAEAALTKGPKIQLGTGVKGSGVGIQVDNNQAVAALPGTGA
ncbi:hypothetical protein MAPG_06314 [Magnaporthiopsis poae ATCC 64411]|uniref:Uncharacterized protein n=1 Tax=Magnaporthiopsis poae (strain ATCC 64411 / 73-15) TaxID=644358 RepID=A0A0C4E1P7_MAGP6|nr:hypothetical protein MAPG_06314 [Magnaporthiopsis poae ATCC 64411]